MSFVFMCIPAVQDSAPDGSRQSQSFEEVRVLDYLRFYQLTGRTPPPCPTHPPGQAERAALGLPPPFSPWQDPRVQAPNPPQPPAAAPGAVRPPAQQPGPYALTMEPVVRHRPEELPRVQVFTPVTIRAETYESLVCAPTFAWYSPEELRYFAYMQGLRYIAAPIPTPPLADVPGASTATPTLIINEEVNETMDHISTHPDFSNHSPEELRLAFMRTGRQLNSQHLMPS